MKTKTLDSTKIYWLDKEETVKVKLVGLDMPHGFGSAKYTFRVLFGGAGDIVYMDSNLPKTIHEVVDGESWQFTTPIAMKCTEEQFNGIKDKLVEMGYKVNWFNRGGVRYLTTNYNSVMGNVDSTGVVYGRGRIIFESFNPDLFLSLAAMTDKEDGIKGECFKCVDIDDTAFGSLYVKTKENFSEMFILDEKELVETGFDCASSSEFRKATAQEIIEHFIEDNNRLRPNYVAKNIQKVWNESIEHVKGNIALSIPPTKQATLFDDRVEITDWKPKEGQLIYYIIVSNFGNIKYRAEIYNSLDYQKESLANGFIKRTESEAKQLVEKLKQAML